MKIEINPGIKKSKKILSLVRTKTKDIKATLFIGTYKNGRENGYRLGIWFRKPLRIYGRSSQLINFLIAENRNSDDIVVYEDTSDTLSDPAYRAAKYFRYNGDEQAANYIVKKIRKYNKENILS